MKTHSERTTLIILAAAGIAVAAAAWYLTCTEEGKETSEDMMDKAHDTGASIFNTLASLIRRR